MTRRSADTPNSLVIITLDVTRHSCYFVIRDRQLRGQKDSRLFLRETRQAILRDGTFRTLEARPLGISHVAERSRGIAGQSF